MGTAASASLRRGVDERIWVKGLARATPGTESTMTGQLLLLQLPLTPSFQGWTVLEPDPRVPTRPAHSGGGGLKQPPEPKTMSASAENTEGITELAGDPCGCPDCSWVPPNFDPQTPGPYSEVGCRSANWEW